MNKIDYSISLNDTSTVKGLAIIAMLLHHLFYTHPEYGVAVQQIGLVGKVCVAMFLFLSGYGLTVQFSNVLNTSELNGGGQTLRFMFKRYVKFYMGYWPVFLIFVPLGVFVFGRGLEVPYGTDGILPLRLLKDFLGLNGLKSYNITWWFNELILTLYFFFPLIYAYTRNKWTALLAMLLSYYSPTYFPFIFSMWVATNIEGIESVLRRVDVRLLCVLSLVLSVGLCFWRQYCTIPYLGGIYIDGFITAVFVLAVVSLRQCLHYDFKLLPFLGKHSMNMYMVHTFIFAYFFKDFIYGFKYPILIFLALLLSSLTASIIIEEIKKRIGLYRLQDYLIDIGNRKL